MASVWQRVSVVVASPRFRSQNRRHLSPLVATAENLLLKRGLDTSYRWLRRINSSKHYEVWYLIANCQISGSMLPYRFLLYFDTEQKVAHLWHASPRREKEKRHIKQQWSQIEQELLDYLSDLPPRH